MTAIIEDRDIIYPSLDRPGMPKVLHHFIGLNTKACLLLSRPRYFQNFDTYTLLTDRVIELATRLPDLTVFNYAAPECRDEKNDGLSFLIDEVYLRNSLPDYILEHIMDLRGELLLFEARFASYRSSYLEVFCARIIR